MSAPPRTGLAHRTLQDKAYSTSGGGHNPPVGEVPHPLRAAAWMCLVAHPCARITHYDAHTARCDAGRAARRDPRVARRRIDAIAALRRIRRPSDLAIGRQD